jgi:hypothetical protein
MVAKLPSATRNMYVDGELRLGHTSLPDRRARRLADLFGDHVSYVR